MRGLVVDPHNEIWPPHGKLICGVWYFGGTPNLEQSKGNPHGQKMTQSRGEAITQSGDLISKFEGSTSETQPQLGSKPRGIHMGKCNAMHGAHMKGIVSNTLSDQPLGISMSLHIGVLLQMCVAMELSHNKCKVPRLDCPHTPSKLAVDKARRDHQKL